MRATFLMTPLLMVFACSGDGNTDEPKVDAVTDGDADTDADADADADTDADTDTDVEDRSAQLDGTVTDLGGSAQDLIQLRLCRGPACRNGETDGAGTYLFEDVHVDWHSFELQGNGNLATAFAPLKFETDEVRTIDVVLPPIDTTNALPASPAELDVAPGLHVTVGVDELEEPLFADPPSVITGARVPDTLWMPTDEIPGTVLAMWYLGPFDYQAPNGLPVRIENEWGLADGTTVTVYTGSYELSEWLDSGTLTAAGSWLEGDAELPHLSTVIVVQ